MMLALMVPQQVSAQTGQLDLSQRGYSLRSRSNSLSAAGAVEEPRGAIKGPAGTGDVQYLGEQLGSAGRSWA